MNCETCKWRGINPEVCKTCKQEADYEDFPTTKKWKSAPPCQPYEPNEVKVTMFKGYNEVSLKN